MHINKSLTFLEQAVIALADNKREHIPYRQSKLTHVLKNSIGGSCQTVMIGNIWGEFGQLEETVNITLEIFDNDMSFIAFATKSLFLSLKMVKWGDFCQYWTVWIDKTFHSCAMTKWVMEWL